MHLQTLNLPHDDDYVYDVVDDDNYNDNNGDDKKKKNVI